MDRTELGMVLYPAGEEPDKSPLFAPARAGAGELDIPAGQITRHDGYATMYLPGRLTGFQPHMHFLGKRAVPRVDLSELDDRNGQLRELRFQLAHRLQL